MQVPPSGSLLCWSECLTFSNPINLTAPGFNFFQKYFCKKCFT